MRRSCSRLSLDRLGRLEPLERVRPARPQRAQPLVHQPRREAAPQQERPQPRQAPLAARRARAGASSGAPARRAPRFSSTSRERRLRARPRSRPGVTPRWRRPWRIERAPVPVVREAAPREALGVAARRRGSARAAAARAPPRPRPARGRARRAPGAARPPSGRGGRGVRAPAGTRSGATHPSRCGASRLLLLQVEGLHRPLHLLGGHVGGGLDALDLELELVRVASRGAAPRRSVISSFL